LSSVTDRSIVLWRLTPDDWQVFRDVRLASLRDSPEAFSATLDATLGRDEAAWRESLAARTQFVAMSGDDVVGTAGGIVDPSGEFGELISMWVSPGWRGKGVAIQLIEEVATWAGRLGFNELRLWVVEGNARAERAYARAGFARTGRTQPVRENESPMEFEMRRGLAAA
jgi:GNAT superfamily N-acetyltransferase